MLKHQSIKSLVIIVLCGALATASAATSIPAPKYATKINLAISNQSSMSMTVLTDQNYMGVAVPNLPSTLGPGQTQLANIYSVNTVPNFPDAGYQAGGNIILVNRYSNPISICEFNLGQLTQSQSLLPHPGKKVGNLGCVENSQITPYGLSIQLIVNNDALR